MTSTTIMALLLAAAAASEEPNPAEAAADGAGAQVPDAIADAGGWHSGPVFYNRRGKKEQLGFTLYTASTDERGVMFRCLDGQLTVSLSLKPVSFGDLLGDRATMKAVSVSYAIGAGAPSSGKWFLFNKLDVIAPPDTVIARKIYNAVARDESISLAIRNSAPVVIDSAPPSPEHFAYFLEACGIAKAKGPDEAGEQ